MGTTRTLRHRRHVRAPERGAPVEVTGDPEARRKFEEYREEQRGLEDKHPVIREMFQTDVCIMYKLELHA